MGVTVGRGVGVIFVQARTANTNARKEMYLLMGTCQHHRSFKSWVQVSRSKQTRTWFLFFANTKVTFPAFKSARIAALAIAACCWQASCSSLVGFNFWLVVVVDGVNGAILVVPTDGLDCFTSTVNGVGSSTYNRGIPPIGSVDSEGFVWSFECNDLFIVYILCQHPYLLAVGRLVGSFFVLTSGFFCHQSRTAVNGLPILSVGRREVAPLFCRPSKIPAGAL